MTDQEYAFFSEFLKEQSGLDLGKPREKEYLLESRLEPLATTVLGLTGLPNLIDVLRSGSNPKVRQLVIEAMTTNETFFFREPQTFEALEKTVLPEFAKKRSSKKSLKLWCAAASSGQEPYTIGIVLKRNEALLRGWNVKMVCSDISEEMLARCRAASYNKFEVRRGLTEDLLTANFEPRGSEWVVKKEIQEIMSFQKVNLIHPFGIVGPFDIIFCRNVLIYFDFDLQRKVISSLGRFLAEDGYLVIGASESLLGITDEWLPRKELRAPFYVKAAKK